MCAVSNNFCIQNRKYSQENKTKYETQTKNMREKKTTYEIISCTKFFPEKNNNNYVRMIRRFMVDYNVSEKKRKSVFVAEKWKWVNFRFGSHCQNGIWKRCLRVHFILHTSLGTHTHRETRRFFFHIVHFYFRHQSSPPKRLPKWLAWKPLAAHLMSGVPMRQRATRLTTTWIAKHETTALQAWRVTATQLQSIM